MMESVAYSLSNSLNQTAVRFPTFYVFKGDEVRIAQRKIWEKYFELRDSRDFVGMYVHIPYCTSRCTYCGYGSCLTKPGGIEDTQVDTLVSEIEEMSHVFDNEEISTISFGGGSPTLLTPDQLKRILDTIDCHWNISTRPGGLRGFEGHPHQVTSEHIAVLRDSFINRMNLGVQSFERSVLKKENRQVTTIEKLSELCSEFHDAGIDVNLDFLIGLYGQTEEMVLRDVFDALTLGTDTVFVYELKPSGTHPVDRPWIRSVAAKLYTHVYPKVQDRYSYSGSTPDEHRDTNIFTRHDNNVFITPSEGASLSLFGFSNTIGFTLPLAERDKSKIGDIPTAHSTAMPVGVMYNSTPDGMILTNIQEEIETRNPKLREVYESRFL